MNRHFFFVNVKKRDLILTLLKKKFFNLGLFFFNLKIESQTCFLRIFYSGLFKQRFSTYFFYQYFPVKKFFGNSKLFFQNEEADGNLYDIIKELANFTDFKINYKFFGENPGAMVYEAKQWNELIGKLTENKADMAVIRYGFTITKSRQRVVDFSRPIMFSTSYYYIRKPDASRVLWSLYYKVLIFINYRLMF